MTDIELNRQFSESRITSIVQDGEESMYFSTSRGLLKYDGVRWSRIATPSPVLTVHFHKNSKRLFVGLKEGVCEILATDSGTFSAVPVLGITSQQPYSNIIGTDNEVFFIGESQIFQLDVFGNNTAIQYDFPEVLITGAFQHDNQLYLLFFQDGLFKWSPENLELVGSYTAMTEDLMLFSFQTGNGTYIGFDSDLLFRFDGKKMNTVSSVLQKFLKDNLLSDGIELNDSLMAISTLAGGAAIVNSRTQEIAYQFDYSTGAKDNEIFCLGKDNDSGLWLAYEEGLTRVDLLQPIRSFSGYPGLEGNITSSLMVNGQLYVGTGNGVFRLQRASNQAEINRMMNEIIRQRRAAKESERATYVPPQVSVQKKEERQSAELLERFKENPKEVKEELSRQEIRELKREIRKQRKAERKKKSFGEAIEDLFTGEGDEEESTEQSATEEPSEAAGPSGSIIPKQSSGPAGSGMTAPPGSGNVKRSKPQVLGKKDNKNQAEQQEARIKQLQNKFLFKKVQNLEVKCRQLIKVGDEVFAATNNGLYLISGNRAENLTPGLYINHAVKRKNDSRILLATIDGITELSKNSFGKWSALALNDSLQFVAYNVAEADDNTVWAGTDNGAFHYTSKEIRFYPVPEVLNERVLVSNIYGKPYFLLPNSVYLHNSTQDTVIATTLPELPAGERLEYLLGNGNVIWVRSSFAWHVINGEGLQSALPYLDLFDDVRHLSVDENQNIYVVDQGKNIYSIEHRNGADARNFNVYIRQVADATGHPFAMGDMKIVTDGSSLIFSVSAPFYLNSTGTEYQYRIKGMRNSWSRWSSNSDIDPGNIPPGDYTLEVRARNVLGEISEVKSLEFSVPQPLYLRWHFILLYVVLLISIVFGIIKYREKSLKETQRILEKKVEERTADLAREKERAEGLLLNILPRETAEELQKSGQATARHYNQVSVMFTDFKGFTEMAESTSPQDLVNALHQYFVAFDKIIDKYYLEKIKTIGDAYMCAGGVPVRNSSNAIAITLAAIEIREYMRHVSEEKKQNGEKQLGIRLGIHTGPLTAGVVGMKKFAYDIWGDTVNTASRMESASEPGHINISSTTNEMIKKYFITEARGKIEVKGKGELEMYFVQRIRPEYADNDEGTLPNKDLLELVS